MFRQSLLCLTVVLIGSHFGFSDHRPVITFGCENYLSGQFYVSDQTPVEGRPLKITVAPVVSDPGIQKLAGVVKATDASGRVVFNESFELTKEEAFTRQLTWTPLKNGMYSLTAELSCEGGQVLRAHLLVPVIVPEHRVDFVWYKDSHTEHLRWPTLFTSTRADFIRSYHARGIVCLRWQGIPGESNDPAEWRARAERIVMSWAALAKNSKEGYDGVGVDEFVALPGTSRMRRSAELLRIMLQHKEALHQGSLILVWHGGLLPHTWLEMYRRTVDYLLVEAYVFGCPWIPWKMWIDSIVASIRHAGGFVPRAPDQPCRTLITLDTGTNWTGIPGLVDVLGPQYRERIEAVFRYLRWVAPEMPGIAFYNGGGGKHVPEWIRERNAAAADELFLKYFLRPVVEIPPDGLRKSASGVAVTVRNIGAMDSGPVTVALMEGRRELARRTISSVPAGPLDTGGSATVIFTLKNAGGSRELSARIVSAPGSTVLEAPADKPSGKGGT